MTVPDKGLGIGTVPLETYRRTLGAWDTTASQLRIRGYADESDNWIYLDLAGSCDLDLTRSRSSFDSSHSLDPICLHFGGLVTAYSYLHGRILTCFRVTGYLHPRRYVLPRPLPHPPFICQAKTIMLLVIYGKQKTWRPGGSQVTSSMGSLDRSDREYKVAVRATGNMHVLEHLFSTRHRGRVRVVYNCCLSNYASGLRGVSSQ